MVSRGTRYQRAAIARQPANILVYANPASTLPEGPRESSMVDATLRKAGYKPTSVPRRPSSSRRCARAAGISSSPTWPTAPPSAAGFRAQRADGPSGCVNATGTELAQAKKDYQRVLKGPMKSQAFLEAIDDAVGAEGESFGRRADLTNPSRSRADRVVNRVAAASCCWHSSFAERRCARAFAQAWVPPAGIGVVSVVYQDIDNTGHRLTTGRCSTDTTASAAAC